jgi:hypothetical protein
MEDWKVTAENILAHSSVWLSGVYCGPLLHHYIRDGIIIAVSCRKSGKDDWLIISERSYGRATLDNYTSPIQSSNTTKTAHFEDENMVLCLQVTGSRFSNALAECHNISFAMGCNYRAWRSG